MSSCVKIFTEERHARPYMVTQRRCVWNKTFLLGPIVCNMVISCILPLFIMFLCVHQIPATPTKASNESPSYRNSSTWSFSNIKPSDRCKKCVISEKSCSLCQILLLFCTVLYCSTWCANHQALKLYIFCLVWCGFHVNLWDNKFSVWMNLVLSSANKDNQSHCPHFN